MKRSISILLLMPYLLFAQDINELKQKAEQDKTAKSWNALAKHYNDTGSDTTALRESAQQAYALAIKENNSTEKGRALMFMAESYFYKGKWAEYIKKNGEAMTFLDPKTDTDLYREAGLNIGYAHNNIGNYDSAITCLNKIIRISEENNKIDSHLASSYINTAFSFLYKGELDSTICYVDKASTTAEIAKDTTVIIESNNHLGILHRRKGDYKKSLTHFEKSLSLYQSFNDYKKMSAVWMNIGGVYHDWKKHDKALAIYRKAAKLTHQHNANDADMMGRSLSNLGQSLINNKHYSWALDTLRIALPYLTQNKYETYTACISLAMVYDKLDNKDSCFSYLQKAEKLLSDNKNFPASRLYSFKGSLYAQKGLYKEAIPLLEKYIELINDPSKVYSTEILDVYSHLSKAYELGFKDYKQALLYQNIAFAKRDSLYKIEHNNALSDFYAQYETAEKELEISRLNEERQETRFKVSVLLAIAILLILSLLIALLYNRIKRLQKEKESILLTTKINEKELENQTILRESELKQMRHYLNGLEVERNRLSKDLHDVVANKIYILDHTLRDIKGIPQSIFDKIEELYNQTRNISHELISPSFQHATLPEILDNLVEETKESTTLQISLNIIPQYYFETLDTNTSHELYRIVQESIANIVKHASAHNVWIDLSLTGNAIRLGVKDDGKGFDSLKPTKGIGLQIIQNRCNSLNGQLTIDSKPGQGCSIKITIPTTLPVVDE